MKALLLILFLILTATMEAAMATAKNSASENVITSDIAVFKFSDKIFFLSDTEKIATQLTLFRCLRPNALLLGKFSDLFQDPIPKVNLENISSYALYFDRLARILKLTKHLESKNETSSFSSEEILTKSKLKGCEGLKNLNPKELRPYLKAEDYLQEKLHPSLFLVSEMEVSLFLSKNPGPDKEKAKLLLHDKKVEESINSMVNTLNRQIPAEFLWK
ncbi:MAG: hypothetical protein HQK50_11845 [Oligoflexia bacterium]|nr:hypothetical protein [Oligoflexia bacterium]MBF0366256.1 hypothetical protein [Oligoflexia bacterium]